MGTRAARDTRRDASAKMAWEAALGRDQGLEGTGPLLQGLPAEAGPPSLPALLGQALGGDVASRVAALDVMCRICERRFVI